jgi:hypothetical protein
LNQILDRKPNPVAETFWYACDAPDFASCDSRLSSVTTKLLQSHTVQAAILSGSAVIEEPLIQEKTAAKSALETYSLMVFRRSNDRRVARDKK